jgi:4'-phosphopantetheinyl transferase
VLSARPADVVRAFGGPAATSLLAPHERRRWDAFRHPADREAYLAAHLLVRECAARLTGLPVASVQVAQLCPTCGSAEHGRPLLAGRADVHLSLGYRRGAVVAGAAGAPLGVDVEPPVTPGAREELVSTVLTPAEAEAVRTAADPAREVLRFWVRKESLVKVGLATLDTLRVIDLTRATDQAFLDGRAHSRLGEVHLVDWFDAGLAAAVGVAASAPPVVAAFGPAAGEPRS